MSYLAHESVLKEECLSYLTGNGFFADLTFGGGGHSIALAQRGETLRVIAFDQDLDAIRNGEILVAENKLPIDLIHSNFSKFEQIAHQQYQQVFDQQGGFQGILMDLGVSSHHFDNNERGFSFRFDGPLDMRMNTENELTAEKIVNNYSEEELARIFYDYGEERFARRIAGKIKEVRQAGPITTTKMLENIIFHSYPKKMRFGHLNPSTRCFQALRIAVNDELNILSDSLRNIFSQLKIGGRLAVISFHSLEDRIVKTVFNQLAKTEQIARVLTKKPIMPTECEIMRNNRSRSAKLRVIERII